MLTTLLIALLTIALALAFILLLRQQRREAELAGLMEYAEGAAVKGER